MGQVRYTDSHTVSGLIRSSEVWTGVRSHEIEAWSIRSTRPLRAVLHYQCYGFMSGPVSFWSDLCSWTDTSTVATRDQISPRGVIFLINSLGSCARHLFILRGRGCGRGIEESGLCVIGAAGLARVDGRRPLIQRCVLAFVRNVAKAVLLRGNTLRRARSRAALHTSLWVRALRLEEEEAKRTWHSSEAGPPTVHRRQLCGGQSYPRFCRQRYLRNVSQVWRCHGSRCSHEPDCETDTDCISMQTEYSY